jgi:hypothetical protein
VGCSDGYAVKGTITQQERDECAKKTCEASLSFNDEIEAYCKQLDKNAANLITAHHIVEEAPDSPNYKEMVETYRKLKIWFCEEVEIGAKPRFEPFLRIRE